MTVLLVGEAPNRQGQGRRPNTTLTGGRLALLGAREMSRTNLLDYWPGKQGKGSAFPRREGREAAFRLLRRTRSDVQLVMVGTRVAEAFGLGRHRYDLLTWYDGALLNGRSSRPYAVVPHPSGVNLWWNDKQNVAAAARFFRELLEQA